MHNTLYKVQEHIRAEYFFWLAVLWVFFLLLSPQGNFSGKHDAAIVAAIVSQSPKANPYDKVELIAKAAYVYDSKTKRALFAKNASVPLPLASITKIMTAATALSLVPETTYIPISARAIKEEGDSGLRVGERWLLRDLLTFMLIESSNDGAVAVSSTIGALLGTSTETVDDSRLLFVQKMNELAETLHFSSTRFLNETGLDLNETQAGARASAEETARMLAYALEKFPSVFKETRWGEFRLKNESGEAHSALNTNKDINTLPLLIASKTGYTDLAGGNLVIAFDAGFNYPIVIAVLGSTTDGRFADVEKLVWATLQFLASQKTPAF